MSLASSAHIALAGRDDLSRGARNRCANFVPHSFAMRARGIAVIRPGPLHGIAERGLTCRCPRRRRFLSVECSLETLCQFLRRAFAPKMEKVKGGFLTNHVVMEGNDVDLRLAQG